MHVTVGETNLLDTTLLDVIGETNLLDTKLLDRKLLDVSVRKLSESSAWLKTGITDKLGAGKA